MVSALLMLRRVAGALRHAVREEEFLAVFGAGATLVPIGTVSYAVGERLYLLIGIGILVEILRRLGIAFVTVRARERAQKAEGRQGPE
jgi:hypothetical protein